MNLKIFSLFMLVVLVSCGNENTAVEVLFAAGCSAQHGLDEHYGQMIIDDILPLEDASLTLSTIEAHSLNSPTETIDFTDPLSLMDNAFKKRERKEKAKKDAEDAVQRLIDEARVKCKLGTEIISAVHSSAERLKNRPTAEKLLIILAPGFEQSHGVNLYDNSLDLIQTSVRQTALEKVVNLLGIPDLNGVTVCFAGITEGDGEANGRLSLGIRAFWQDFFKAAGAELASYNVSLENCPIPRT